MGKSSVLAHPNIAFIKYWGKADADRNLPANPSLSMNLAALITVTTVEFRPGQASDHVTLDGQPATGRALARVIEHLNRIRVLAGIDHRATVASRNDFPAGTGLASSASGFAALSVAATRAAGLDLDESALSRLARRGSGSACRSVPGGFVLWDGDDDESSLGRQVAPASHWALWDLIAVVSDRHKAVGSQDGHALAPTSPFFGARLSELSGRLATVRAAIERRDLARLGPAVEADSLAMHAVMMTSQPSLLYWSPATVAVLQAVRRWQAEGLAVYTTMDAGPNVHCLCEARDAAQVDELLRDLPGVRDVLASGPGEGARRVEVHLF